LESNTGKEEEEVKKNQNRRGMIADQPENKIYTYDSLRG